MRIKSGFETLSSFPLAAILFVTSAELAALSQVWCLLACDNCHECGCLCAFPTPRVWNRKRGERDSGSQSVSDSLALGTLCQSDLHVAKCAPTSVCTRARRGDRSGGVGGWSGVPSAWDGSSADLRRAPLSGTSAHPCQAHTSAVRPGAYYQTANPTTAANPQKTHGASLSVLHLLISRGGKLGQEFKVLVSTVLNIQILSRSDKCEKACAVVHVKYISLCMPLWQEQCNLTDQLYTPLDPIIFSSYNGSVV